MHAVADDDDLGGVQPHRGAGSMHHAGAGLFAMAAVEAGHEIEQVVNRQVGEGLLGR